MEEIEKELLGRGSHCHAILYDAIRDLSIDPAQQKTVLERLGLALDRTLMDQCLSEMRSFVELERTEPVAAMFVGRALRELGAVDEARAKNRIEVFGFFSQPPSNAVLGAVTGVASKASDYLAAAQECHEYVQKPGKPPAKRVKSKGGKSAGRAKPPTSASRMFGNVASRALEKPIDRLEMLRMADSRVDANGKREGSYLRSIAHSVFEEWPDWRK